MWRCRTPSIAGGPGRASRGRDCRVVAHVRDEAAGGQRSAVCGGATSVILGSSSRRRRRGPSRSPHARRSAPAVPSARRRRRARRRPRGRCGRRGGADRTSGCRCRCRSPRRRRRVAACAGPVGSSPAHTEPAVSRKLMVIGAAVPGTPSMRASPRRRRRPAGVSDVMSDGMPVFSVSMRGGRFVAAARSVPVSSANGRTAASMLPQFGVVSTRVAVGLQLGEQEFEIHPGLLLAATMPTLLVSGSAPPRPSIWRRSGDPIAASSTGSRSATIGRKVRGAEERSARRAAAHEPAGNGGLHGDLSERPRLHGRARRPYCAPVRASIENPASLY